MLRSETDASCSRFLLTAEAGGLIVAGSENADPLQGEGPFKKPVARGRLDAPVVEVQYVMKDGVIEL